MKMNHALMMGAALACLSLNAAKEVRAQEAVVRTTTTRNAGTITEFGPEGMVIRSETATEPQRYGFTTATTYVDEEGRPVSVTEIRTGIPASVEYARVGKRLVANRVIVRRMPAPAGTVVEKKTTVGNATVVEKKSMVGDDTVIEKKTLVPADTVIEKKTVVPQDTVIEKKTVAPEGTVIEKKVVPDGGVVEKKTTTTTTTEKR